MNPSTTSLDRIGVLFASSIREQFRNSVIVGMLVVLPILFIVVPSLVSPTYPHPIWLEHDVLQVISVRPLVDVHSVMMTTTVGSFVTGISGLFLIQSAHERDQRLVVAGFEPIEILLARFGLLICTALVVCTISVLTLATFVSLGQPIVYLAAVLIPSLTYGFIGVILGSITSRLTGMYLVLFLPIVDVTILHDPMLITRDLPWIATITPIHAPLQISMDAAFTDGFGTLGYLALAIGYAVLTGTVAVIVYVERILGRA